MPGHDASVELQDLRLEHPQLRAKGGKTLACDLWHAIVIRIGDDVEQLLDTVAADRRDDPELGKMGADRIDHRGLLPNEEMTRAMEHEAALLLGRLGLHEAHARSHDGFADGLGIGSIVLLAFEVGLHVGRRHQPNGVAERLQLTRPMMRRSASLDADKARWQLLEEWQNLAALQLSANNNIALRVHPMNLEDRLGDIETDRCDRLHAWLLRIVVTSTATTSLALTCRWRSRPQHQVRTVEGDASSRPKAAKADQQVSAQLSSHQEFHRAAVSRTVVRAQPLFVPDARAALPCGRMGNCREKPVEARMAKTRSSTDDVVDLQRQNEELTKELWQNKSALREALSDIQAATSEILRVISSSPTDMQRVFTALAYSAVRLCDAYDAAIFQVEGDTLRFVAHEGPIRAMGPVGQATLPLVRGTVVGRAVLDRQTIEVPDLQVEGDEYPEGSEFARRLGHRTILAVPLICAGEAIGAISVRRAEVRPFTDQQAELLQTFAEQAVIAIENTRLFEEVQGQTRELQESLEYQTATSEVSSVI